MANSDKILAVTLQKMQNWAHNTFMQRVKDLLEAEKALFPGSEQMFEAFRLAVQAEYSASLVRRRSALTEEMVRLNDERERIYAGFYYHYQSCTLHYQEEIRNAAALIEPSVKKIASVHNTSNVKRTVLLMKIGEHIREQPTAVDKLSLQGWLDALDGANKVYSDMRAQRFEQESAKGDGNVLRTRVVTDEAYKAIVKRVNALIVIEGEEKYADFTRRMNIYIEEEKRRIAIREGMRRHRKKMKNEEGSKETPIE